MNYDFIIIGGGIIGAATAWHLVERYPDARVLLLEKEHQAGSHQTGHNSGVIHAGLYYEPGSLKASFCRDGAQAMIAFCEESDVPYERCGKLLVATSRSELAGMEQLRARCRENNVEAETLGAEDIPRLEPEIRGAGALLVPSTAIVDFTRVCNAMLDRFRKAGGETRFGSAVQSVTESDGRVTVQLNDSRLHCGYAVCCAGLMSDRLARRSDMGCGFRIIPFRGEYFRLPAARRGLVRRLIYPIPDPALPFLGIHITRTIGDEIIIGPNAVPGWKREGYGRLNFHLVDTFENLAWPGFWRMLWQHRRQGMDELANAMVPGRYLARLRRYCPSLQSSDLKPGPAGVRAQAVRADGSLVQDFLFVRTPRVVHVCNAPSPAATSAIPIARHLLGLLEISWGS